MEPGNFVVVNLNSPGERFAGRLIAITTAGVTVRGLDVGAFQDWMDAISSKEDAGIHPTTVFFPSHRVDKIMLDEDSDAIPSLSTQFLERTGTVIDELLR